MVVKEIIKDMLPSMWPLITFVSVVAISLRLAFLKGSKSSHTKTPEEQAVLMRIISLKMRHYFKKVNQKGEKKYDSSRFVDQAF